MAKIPIYSYDDLRKKADDFLRTHNPSGTIPVPFLVRNERHFQIYNFNDGQPIEPDFVLFLKKKDLDLSIHYQVFIESKGEHLLKYDEWKENFLKSLKDKHRISVLWKSKKYIVWGMPFYNEALKKTEFDNEFKASFL